MKSLYLLPLLMLMAGCGSMTNDDIVREAKKCTDAGYKWDLLQNGLGQPTKVVCLPPK